MLPLITMEGRVVADPELRFAPSGTAVTRMRMVASSRKKNEAGEWEDDKTFWITVTCFKKLAENVAESIVKGDLVNVTGRIQTDEWEKDGQKQTAPSVIADTVSLSLAFRTVTPGGGAPRAAAAGEAAPAPAQADEPPF